MTSMILVSMLLAQAPQHRLFLQPNLPASSDFALYELFPASGAGVPAACSTTPPTGAKGETLTFSRTGSATCTATATGGLSTTGIANGDLVSMSANVPRVEYGSDGVKGLLVESSRTNYVLRSQELANGVWVALGAGGAAAPTVTATYATGPDNGTTATRVQVNACAGVSQASVVYQNYTGTAAAFVGAPYLRGTSGSGTINVYFYDTTAGTGNAVQCSFVADSWTRCAPVSKTFANTTHRIGFGCLNDAVVTSSTNTGATDVLIYGAQSEPGTYLTSYIPTTSAAVTRAAESAAFNGLSISSAAGLSWAATVQHPAPVSSGVWMGAAGVVQDASNRTQLYRQNFNVLSCDYLSTSGSRTSSAVIASFVAGQVYRQACSYSGAGASSVVTAYLDGVAGTPSAAGATSAFTATSVLPGALGAAPTAGPNDAINSRICVDPSPTRCR